jgi:hypothetical protein
MDGAPSANLPIPSALIAQLRDGRDLAFDLVALDPRDARARRWLTTVRVHVPGYTLARSLEGSLLAITLISVPEITIPNLRWDPPDTRHSR